jgi:large subunit ribosomal protein L29
MTAEELRQLSPDELRVKEKEMREQLARLRFQLAAGQTESVKKLRVLRKDIARLLSVRREREARVSHAGER